MSRALTWINLLGVLALVALCALQWRTNSALARDLDALQRTRLDQAARLEEQATRLQGLTADLDRFRAQLGTTTLSLQDASAKLRAADLLSAQLTRERDQLKEAIAQWTAAVATRDDRLREANARIRDLGTQLHDAVLKYNALVATHNDLVKQLDAARAAPPPSP